MPSGRRLASDDAGPRSVVQHHRAIVARVGTDVLTPHERKACGNACRQFAGVAFAPRLGRKAIRSRNWPDPCAIAVMSGKFKHLLVGTMEGNIGGTRGDAHKTARSRGPVSFIGALRYPDWGCRNGPYRMCRHSESASAGPDRPSAKTQHLALRCDWTLGTRCLSQSGRSGAH